MNFDRRYALYIHSFITGGISQSAGARIRAYIFNRCNDATVRTREVPLVHALCNVITLSRGLHAVASRNKWINLLGNAGKLTLWTSLINPSNGSRVISEETGNLVYNCLKIYLLYVYNCSCCFVVKERKKSVAYI